LLRKDPRSRFTVQEALIHPWIARHTAQCDQESDTTYDNIIVPKMLKPIQNLKTDLGRDLRLLNNGRINVVVGKNKL
jgi:serine/threonine protein kinase